MNHVSGVSCAVIKSRSPLQGVFMMIERSKHVIEALPDGRIAITRRSAFSARKDVRRVIHMGQSLFQLWD